MAEILTAVVRERSLDMAGVLRGPKTSRMTDENWNAIRRTGIGGSDASKLIFPNRYGGPLVVYLSKVSDDSPSVGNDYTDFGTIMETVLRTSFLPTALGRIGAQDGEHYRISSSPWLYRSAERPWMLANIDGLLEVFADLTLEDGTGVPPGLYILELKTAGANKRDEWADGAVPDGYFAQVQHYMDVCNLSGAFVFGLVDRKPEIRFVPRNDGFIGLLRAKEEELWKQVQEQSPPLPMGFDADLDALALIYPEAKGTALVEREDVALHAREYLQFKAAVKAAEAGAKEHEAWLKGHIGDDLGIQEGNLASAKWTRWAAERFDSKRFKAEHPDLYERYTKTIASSRLTVRCLDMPEDDE